MSTFLLVCIGFGLPLLAGILGGVNDQADAEPVEVDASSV